MANRAKYRKRWMRWQRQYERSAYRELQKTFHDFANNIPWDRLDPNGYTVQIRFATDEREMLETYKRIYIETGLIHGERVGKSINLQLKEFTSNIFTSEFLKNIVEFFLNPANNWHNRIRTVNKAYAEEIIKMLSTRVEQGMTIEEAQREVRRIVNKPNFYRYQALRIARTESTASANFGAVQASGVSGFVMEKEWISALDARTRRPPESHFNHYTMNGVRVPEKGLFDVNGEKLRYPGDPKASAGNVINCRCTVAVVAKRDSEGNLIPT